MSICLSLTLDPAPLPITRIIIPEEDRMAYRIETMPYSDFVTITSETIKLELSKLNEQDETSKAAYDLLRISTQLRQQRKSIFIEHSYFQLSSQSTTGAKCESLIFKRNSPKRLCY